MASVIAAQPKSELCLLVEQSTRQKISDCYQCGKCSAGCPTFYAMDFGPRRIMRALQLGLDQEVLNSSSIWLCVSCMVCSARCPRQIDVESVMESLRQIAVARGIKPADRDVELFHRIFLGFVRRQGRIYELGLAGFYNLLSGHLLNNISLVPGMLSKGKLSIMPQKTRGASEVKAVFARVAEAENNSRKT